MEGRQARDARDGGDDRTLFARFSEATYERVSGPGFFVVCVAIVAAWAVSFPLFSSAKSWQVVIHTVGTGAYLVVALENASKRAEEASQGEAQRAGRGAGRADGLAGTRRPGGP